MGKLIHTLTFFSPETNKREEITRAKLWFTSIKYHKWSLILSKDENEFDTNFT